MSTIPFPPKPKPRLSIPSIDDAKGFSVSSTATVADTLYVSAVYLLNTKATSNPKKADKSSHGQWESTPLRLSKMSKVFVEFETKPGYYVDQT